MSRKFVIRLASTDSNKPLISKRIVAYFEELVYREILSPHKIILNATPNICLAFIIMETGGNIPSKVQVLPGQSVSGDKLYSIIIPSEKIRADDSKLMIIKLFYEAIRLFFTKNYKSISEKLLDEIESKIDVNYLLSIPFPAPAEEVEYIGG